MRHPKERPGQWQSNRRDFLARSGGAVVGASSLASLLAACSNSTTASVSSGTGKNSGVPLGPSGQPLARPDRRVTLPLWEDPIASGMQPETGGEFTVFNYPDYIYRRSC